MSALNSVVWCVSPSGKVEMEREGGDGERGSELCELGVGCVTGYQVIRVIRIFAKTYPFGYQLSITRKNRLVNFIYSK